MSRLPPSISSLLVVEDDPEVREILVSLLRAAGAERIWAVESAESALDLVGRNSFSIILADYRLSGMDGVALVETLRNRNDQTPVLLISGAPDKQGIIRAVSHPRVDFFGKPFQIDELLRSVERLAMPTTPSAAEPKLPSPERGAARHAK